jgi:hypothetical protein
MLEKEFPASHDVATFDNELGRDHAASFWFMRLFRSKISRITADVCGRVHRNVTVLVLPVDQQSSDKA